ncbi:MAG: hypothetical protein VX670_12095, partial [Candidatus Latescibacterota bacterium]|nr:hypothetical protein [Candidatus Latescibacterota bacterium]
MLRALLLEGRVERDGGDPARLGDGRDGALLRLALVVHAGEGARFLAADARPGHDDRVADLPVRRPLHGDLGRVHRRGRLQQRPRRTHLLPVQPEL